MNESKVLTQERIRELFLYFPFEGKLVNRVDRGNGVKSFADYEAGSKESDGYMQVGIEGKVYKSHRIIWLYVHGFFPEHQIDHIKGVRDDNRLHMLRHATQFCNMQNKKKNIRNTSGFTGVSWRKNEKKWQSYVKMNNKNIHLGYYKTTLNAALARLTFEMQCDKWSCNNRNVIVKQIKEAWPDFNDGCI